MFTFENNICIFVAAFLEFKRLRDHVISAIYFKTKAEFNNCFIIHSKYLQEV